MLSLAPRSTLCESGEKRGSFKKTEREERQCVGKRMGRVMISFLHAEEVSVDKLQMFYKQVVLVTIHIAALVYMH